MQASDQHAPIGTVGLVVNAEREGAVKFAEELGEWLRLQGLNVCASRNITRFSEEADARFDNLIANSDLVVVLGGDGSMLGTSRRAAPAGRPMLGIHWGGMGFLNECTADQAREALTRVLDGDYHLEERMMLLAQVRRDGHVCSRCSALNDVAVTRQTLSRILRLTLAIGEVPVATYRGDGVVVSTPTGSTGHSLSAGGPVVDPRVDAIAVTPICPHSLNGRSILAPGNERLLLRHSSPLANVLITLDGQVGMSMMETDCLEIGRAPWPARLVRLGYNQFYRAMRDKLHWEI